MCPFQNVVETTPISISDYLFIKKNVPDLTAPFGASQAFCKAKPWCREDSFRPSTSNHPWGEAPPRGAKSKRKGHIFRCVLFFWWRQHQLESVTGPVGGDFIAEQKKNTQTEA